MQTIVIQQPREIQLVARDIPEPGPAEVLIRE